MTCSADEAREIAVRAVAMTAADQAEAVVVADSSALTRFAGNRIHQNVAETDARISVRAVIGKRVGVASTNRLDDESLRSCCDAAAAAARLAPEDPGFPGLPSPEPITLPDRAAQSVRAFGPRERAQAALSIIAQSAEHALVAAGTVSASESAIAVANSLGVRAAQETTGVAATVLSTGANGGSGWASFIGMQPSALAPQALGDRAAETAMRSERPIELEAGRYTTLLAPEAVADLVFFLAYAGFSAKTVAEGRSFMAGHEGERLFSESFCVRDDALADHALGITFDFEGMPKRRTPIVEAGVAVGPVTDSYWAARTARPNTRHALPAPNAFGPFPLDLEVAEGDASEDELLASVERGVYVSRFHYVNVEDPVRVVLTGMTRDGTFLIQNGRLGAPVKNLRFTQNAIEALAGVVGVGSQRVHAGERGAPLYVPALLLDGFEFTGQTR